jgi:hypothetical protein
MLLSTSPHLDCYTYRAAQACFICELDELQAVFPSLGETIAHRELRTPYWRSSLHPKRTNGQHGSLNLHLRTILTQRLGRFYKAILVVVRSSGLSTAELHSLARASIPLLIKIEMLTLVWTLLLSLTLVEVRAAGPVKKPFTLNR